jgi:putative transposase
MNSRRRLPHSYPEGRWLFVTWTLHGSLSSGRFPPPAKATSGEAKATSGEAVTTSGEAFAWIDRYLDNARTGPQHLRQPSIAQVVIDSLFRGIDLGHYELGPFVIMANHVHVLLKPLIAVPHLLKSLKGATAREANRLLNRTGEQFWQRESYDHWVRDEQEWDRIARYIERNPVKAGLASRVEEYLWSSANPELGVQKNTQQSVHTSVNAARTSACATKESDPTRTSACATATAKILA